MMAALLLGALIASSPLLGQSEGKCRTPEPGPAFLVDVQGLKDRAGMAKLELYPANDKDFLQDDNILISAGKAFARVEEPVIRTEGIMLCIRAPRPGAYVLSLLHDRNGDHRFNLAIDGIGFSGNPRLGWSKPPVAGVTIMADTGVTRTTIILNYRHGLSMRPLKAR